MPQAQNQATSLIHDYIDYANKRTDAPVIFKKYMAYALMSGMISDRNYLELPHATIRPNIYMMLVGHSGARKSTCINHMREIFSQSSPRMIWSSNFSDEGLLYKLQREQCGIIIENEFSKMASNFAKPYALQAKPMITDIWDCPDSLAMPIRVEERPSEDEFIRNPILSIITASTPEWILDYMKAEDVAGGFMARFLVVYGDERIPDHIQEDYQEEKQSLIERTHHIRDFEFAERLKRSGIPDIWQYGPMYLTPEAKEAYHEWKSRIDYRLRVEDQLKIISGVIDRICISVYKFAMVHATCDLTVRINEDHINQATPLGDELIENAKKFHFKIALYANKNIMIIEKLREMFRESADGQVRFREMQRRLHKTKRDLLEPIVTMVENGEIRRFENGRIIGYEALDIME